MEKLFQLLFSKPVLLVFAVIAVAFMLLDLWLAELGKRDRIMMIAAIGVFLLIALFSVLTIMAVT